MGLKCSISFIVAFIMLLLFSNVSEILVNMQTTIGFSKPNVKQPVLQEIIGKRWFHVSEKDKGDVKIYQTDTKDLSLARGRDSFEIMTNGTFVHHGIGSNDRSNNTYHSYFLNVNDNATITVKLENNDMCMFIESYNSNVLSLRQWFVSNTSECNKPS
jgi:hypothetical protein